MAAGRHSTGPTLVKLKAEFQLKGLSDKQYKL